MRTLVQETSLTAPLEAVCHHVSRLPGTVLLQSALFNSPRARYSYLAAAPFLELRTFGSRCELRTPKNLHVRFGNPWQVMNDLMARYELPDEWDLPFPLGGCFGYWGYGLRHFVEPKLARQTYDDLGLPDCVLGFYDSLLVMDHHLQKTWIISTGLDADGNRSESKAREQLAYWQHLLETEFPPPVTTGINPTANPAREAPGQPITTYPLHFPGLETCPLASTFSQAGFESSVRQAQRYIRSGDIYQVNLAQRLTAELPQTGWDFFQHLLAVSPAPFSGYYHCGDFQLACSSPELFLRFSGSSVQTCPIKGTRPRALEPERDAQLAFELQTSAKETAELIMITDLLRNDLGKVCEYGTVRVPELMRLERFPQVQHLVSTVEGRLRPALTHFDALAACFPGGSITGAPKFRAMEIIEELEPVSRGPYTGCLGYLGFNRESQLNIIIRTALCRDSQVHFHTGAGIVADSDPRAEYEETLAKAHGFTAALQRAGTPITARKPHETLP